MRSLSTQVNDGGRSWNVTYKWTNNYFTVHGFPHMRYESGVLPLQLNNISSLNLKATWNTVPVSAIDTNASYQAMLMDYDRVSANVALDMFADPFIAESQQRRPRIEIMIWLWNTPGLVPVGGKTSLLRDHNYTVAGKNLYVSLLLPTPLLRILTPFFLQCGQTDTCFQTQFLASRQEQCR